MANSTNRYAALVAGFKPQLEAAIARSESHSEIVSVTLDCDDIGTVASLASDYADNTDYVRENDGAYDMWGWSDEMAEGEMLWRLRVTLS